MNEQNPAQAFLQLCWPTLIELDGSIFIADVLPPDGPQVDTFFDRTAAEAFYNHVHLLDILPPVVSSQDTAPFGDSIAASYSYQTIRSISLFLVHMWRTQLRRNFPSYRFRLYVTQEDEPIIRFHRVRDGEPLWLDPADWTEQIANGSVVIYDTDNR